MDLETVVVTIREKLEKSYNLLLKHAGFLENRDMGFGAPGGEEIRSKIQPTIKVDIEQFEGDYTKAREKFIEEASFTTLNRLVGIKVMECRGFINRTVITKKSSTADKSEEHFLYLNVHPEKIKEPGQGINTVLEKSQQQLASEIPQLYGENRYGIFPRDSDTMAVIDLINSVPDDEWKKDDVIGWTYQYYQAKTKREVYDYLSKKGKIDSHSKLIAVTQCYTEKYIVKYLLENTLGRLWLEMHPHSQLRQKMSFFDNNPELITRSVKSVEDLTIIDPAGGSGHFLLYAFDLLYEMYIEERGFSDSIPAKIIKNNLFGLDIDPRSIQLMALSLYIKAKSKSKNVDLNGSNLYTLKVTNFENKDIMKLTGFLNLKNPVENDFFNSILHTKHLDLIGSLFRLRNGKNSMKNSINFFNTIHSYETKKTQFIDKFIKVIEDHFPAEKDALSSLTGEDYKYTFHAIRLLFGSYDVVITNPPYRDSGTLSENLKKYLSEYYPDSKSDLYAAFIEKCLDLAKDQGYIGMVTMQSFLYISSFEKLRKNILGSNSIVTLTHLGPGAFQSIGGEIVNTVMFVIGKNQSRKDSSFFNVKDLNYEHKIDFMNKYMKSNQRHYELNQSRFHLIPGSPFVYWISDNIRNLFTQFKPLQNYVEIVVGLQTSDNDRFLRYWWEVNKEDISQDYKTDYKKWVMYAKGGPFNKWYGNLWWVVNWENEGREIKECFDDSGKLRSRPQNESYYLKEGITYSFVSSFGFSVRHLPFNCIFDVGGSSLFIKNYDIKLFLSLLTSILIKNIMKILNPTVNYQVGDLKNIPIPDSIEKSTKLAPLAQANIDIKKSLYSFHLIERDFKNDPLIWGLDQVRNLANTKKIIPEALKAFLVHKANLESQLLLNEAKVDEEVFRLYELLPNEVSLWDVVKLSLSQGEDQNIIPPSEDEEKFVPLPRGEWFGEGDFDSGNLESHPQLKAEEKIQGHPHLTSPLKGEELKYLNPFKGEEMKNINEEIGRFKAVIEVLESEGVPVGIYPKRELNDQELNELKTLYLTHRHDRGSGKSEAIGGMEFGIVAEVAGKLRVSPQTVVEEIEEIDELPVEAVKDIMTEHIQALVLKIMREDSDGIVPVNAPTREKTLFHRLLEKWNELGIGNDYDWIERYLGTDIQHYLESKFFKDHCQRFMNRPIVYHLVSERRTIGFFVLHHAWNRDRVLLLSSKYCSEAKNTLNNLLASETNPKKRVEIENQLRELAGFTHALLELLQSGYSPTVDLGVSRNCAPLQKKKLLASDVLSSKLMDKMLNAKWE
jgi:hypothetical protein